MTHLSHAGFDPAAAMAARPRGVFAAPRADVSNPAVVAEQLMKAWTEFKAEYDRKISAKIDDTVVTEKIDRINADVGRFQAAIDDLTAKLASAQAGGTVIGDIPPDPAYVTAFKAHMRRGTPSAALEKTTDANGGYLAPVEWDRTITAKLKDVSPIRANASVISISTSGFKKLFSDSTTASGWVGETAARPGTGTPAIGSLDFTPGELYANPAISQQLLDDAAVNLEAWLAGEVQLEFSKQEGAAFVNGNGTNKPYGILTYVTGAANAARHPFGAIGLVNSGAAAALTGDGLLNLTYDLPAAFEANAKFYASRPTIAKARLLKDGQNNYLWQPSYILGQPSTLAGYPVVSVADMPAVAADAVPILFGDMAATYLVVDRIGITVLRDPFSNKPYVHFYTVKRVGGGVKNPEAMRGQKIAVVA